MAEELHNAAPGEKPEIETAAEPRAADKNAPLETLEKGGHTGPAKLMLLVDALLKTPEAIIDSIKEAKFNKNLFAFMMIAVLCHIVYGLIVGSFSGNAQWIASPIKIIAGTALSALLCYPSLYIFASLSGANITPGQVFSLLVSAFALVAILLIGFAPVAFIFTFSIKSIHFMGMIHLLCWSISIYFGIRYIRTGIKRMQGENNNLIITWSVILILTMLQMTATLRPILGESDKILTSEKSFFVEHWVNSLTY